MNEETFLILDGETIVFIGDSITDCGRRGAHAPYGCGYVKRIIDMVTARYPERMITYHNRGIGGDVVTGLQRRWGDDVISLKPDWVSILIGINDSGRTFRPDAEQIDPDRYAEVYETLLTRTREQTDARLVMMDPFLMTTETHPSSTLSRHVEWLAGYIRAVSELAERFEAIHIPLHEIFAEQLRYRPAGCFGHEAVHPNEGGVGVITNAWLTAMGW
jgi:lysophospholipase L1-like esterase